MIKGDISLNKPAQEKQWIITWQDRSDRTQQLLFELDQGKRYSVVVHSEEDKARFLGLFLRPPETGIISPDGGLLSNIRVDENILLPLNYHGLPMATVEQKIIELFGLCGLNETETRDLMVKLPSQLSSFQKRLVGFVRSTLMNPRIISQLFSGIYGNIPGLRYGFEYTDTCQPNFHPLTRP